MACDSSRISCVCTKEGKLYVAIISTSTDYAAIEDGKGNLVEELRNPYDEDGYPVHFKKEHLENFGYSIPKFVQSYFVGI